MPLLCYVMPMCVQAGKKYEDAAVAFTSAGALDRALDAYRTAGQWRMVFTTAARLGYSERDTRSLAAAIVEELTGIAQVSRQW